MKTVIISLITFAFGAITGIMTMCCLFVSGEEKRKSVKENKKQEADTE